MKIVNSSEPKQFTSEHGFDGYHLALNYGLIEVYGGDARRFLHAQTTSDVGSLAEMQGQASALLDRKAHVMAYFSLFRKHDSYRILAGSEQITDIIQHLEKFHFSEKVEFLDLSQAGKFIGLFGLHSRKLLTQAITRPTGVNIFAHDLIDAHIYGRHVHIFRMPVASEEVFFIWVNNDDWDEVTRKLQETAAAMKLKELSADELKEARIEAGVPLFGVDFDSENLIVELGLEDPAVSYTKGCFQGQEVLARVKAHGTPAKQLTGLTFAADVNDGKPFPLATRLMSGGQEAATIYSNCYCRKLDKVLALAFVKKDLRVVDTVIKGQIEGRDVEAKVTLLPFVQPQDVHARALKLYEKGLALFTAEASTEAIELLKESIVLHPSFEDAYEALGVILSKTGQIDEAIEWMQRLAELNPDSVMAHANLSVFWLEKGDKEKAEDEKAISMSIRMRMAARDAVKAKQEKEDEVKLLAETRERMTMFNQVLEIDADDLLANYGIGSCYNILKEYDKAIAHLQKAISIKATHTQAYLELGKAYRGQGLQSEAVQSWKKGIEIASQKGDMTPLKEMQSLIFETEQTSS
ncbi:MAG: tetratricopeptide repeat protein [Cyanobacteria bacterium SZAS TMP-1]|nr:tetratricopeptide repeat protein [Cyanobacteria bacterium SZAS TMP-1]